MRIRRPAMVGVALVAAVGLAGCGPHADRTATPAPAVTTAEPGGASVALAAAAAKVNEESVRIKMTMGGGIGLSGVTDARARKSDLRLQLGALGGDLRMLRVGSDYYLEAAGPLAQLAAGKRWLHVDEASAGAVSAYDPTKMAQLLQSAAHVQRVGEHGFQGTLDLTKAASVAGSSPPAGIDVTAPGAKAVPFTATTDAQGRLVGLTMTMAAIAPQAGTLKATFSDFGAPLTVTAPAKAQVAEMPEPAKSALHN